VVYSKKIKLRTILLYFIISALLSYSLFFAVTTEPSTNHSISDSLVFSRVSQNVPILVTNRPRESIRQNLLNNIVLILALIFFLFPYYKLKTWKIHYHYFHLSLLYILLRRLLIPKFNTSNYKDSLYIA